MPKVKKIDHIGIVVSDMKAGIEKYKNLLFQGPSFTERFDPGKVDWPSLK